MKTPDGEGRIVTAGNRFIMALFAAMLSVTVWAAGASAAQEIAPLHFPGPIYGWLDHQPTQAEIERREKMLGMNTGAQQRTDRAQDRELQQLYNQLMSDTGSCAVREVCPER